MQIIELNDLDISIGLTLLFSDIEFLENKTVIISLYFDIGLLKLHSTNLLSISTEHLDLSVDKKITLLKIKEGCEIAIEQLQNFFSRAVDYEYYSN